MNTPAKRSKVKHDKVGCACTVLAFEMLQAFISQVHHRHERGVATLLKCGLFEMFQLPLPNLGPWEFPEWL